MMSLINLLSGSRKNWLLIPVMLAVTGLFIFGMVSGPSNNPISVAAQSSGNTIKLSFPSGSDTGFVIETTGQSEILSTSGEMSSHSSGNQCFGSGTGGAVTISYSGVIKKFKASDGVEIEADGRTMSKSEFVSNYMTCSSDSGDSTGTDSGNLTTDSNFEKETSLPSCDASNPEVMIVDTSDNLENALNRDDKRIFCIKPGDYRDQSGDYGIFITTSGSENSRRYLLYYNPDMPGDTHPWNMDDPESKTGNKRAFLPQIHLRASYWTFDRLRFDNTVHVETGVSNVVLNRLMWYQVPGSPDNQAVAVGESEHVWVQNSVIGGFPQWDVGSGTSGNDNLALNVVDSDYVYFIDNEVWDMFNGDAVQTVAYGSRSHIKRTVIADNDIWLTDSMNDKPYENAFDFKLGPDKSWSKDQWAVIQDNRIWNLRNQDSLMNYAPVQTHKSSNDAYIFKNNIIWNSEAPAILTGNKGSRNIIEGNIIYNQEPGTYGNSGIRVGAIMDSSVRNNIIIDSSSGWHWGNDADDNPPENMVLKHNVFLNTDVGKPQYEPANTITENAFYSSTPFDGDNSDSIVEDSVSAANHQDLTFQVREITGPETKTIPDAKVTTDSPHSDWFQ